MKFSTIGRVLAATNVIAMPGLAIWQFTSASVLSMYIGFMAILVGIIELPLLCSCMKWCIVAQRYTRFIAGRWVTRAIIYIGISAGGYAIYQIPFAPISDPTGPKVKEQNLYLLATLLSLTATSGFYLFATYKKEDNPGADAGGAAEAKELGGQAAGWFGRKAATAARNNPDVVASVAAAAAPTIAQQMFGGGGGQGPSASSGSAKGFYDDEESGNAGGYAPPDVNSFGGSAFGGSSSTGKSSSGKGGAAELSSIDDFHPGGGSSMAPSAPSGGGGKAKASAYGVANDDDDPDTNPFLS